MKEKTDKKKREGDHQRNRQQTKQRKAKKYRGELKDETKHQD
jgi:hypothetical protein